MCIISMQLNHFSATKDVSLIQLLLHILTTSIGTCKWTIEHLGSDLDVNIPGCSIMALIMAVHKILDLQHLFYFLWEHNVYIFETLSVNI